MQHYIFYVGWLAWAWCLVGAILLIEYKSLIFWGAVALGCLPALWYLWLYL